MRKLLRLKLSDGTRVTSRSPFWIVAEGVKVEVEGGYRLYPWLGILWYEVTDLEGEEGEQES